MKPDPHFHFPKALLEPESANRTPYPGGVVIVTPGDYPQHPTLMLDKRASSITYWTTGAST